MSAPRKPKIGNYVDRPFTQPGSPGIVPTIDEIRAFLHKQIAEVRAMGQREGEDVTDRVNDMLEKLHGIDETHAFIEQTIGDSAAAAWVETIDLNYKPPSKSG